MTVIVTLNNDSIIQFINCAYTKAFRLIKILDSENEIKQIDVYVPSVKTTFETYKQFYDYYNEGETSDEENIDNLDFDKKDYDILDHVVKTNKSVNELNTTYAHSALDIFNDEVKALKEYLKSETAQSLAKEVFGGQNDN